MGVWEDLQDGWSKFDDWLGTIGQILSETYGQLGQGIMSGLMWIGSKIKDAFEWLYDGMVWMGNKFKEAWDKLSEWVTCGLQWIGSGLSWVGQNLYNFGHWLYNGILAAIRWILNAFSTVLNWIGNVLSSIWNALCNIPATFIEGFNVMISSWTTSLRGKFKNLFIVNTMIPAVGHGIENLSQKPSVGGVIGLFLTPLASVIIAEVLDTMIPKPESQTITIFPPMTLPTWESPAVEVDFPPEEEAPEQTGVMEFPSTGYEASKDGVASIGTSYEIDNQYGGQKFGSSGIGIEYELEVT